MALTTQAALEIILRAKDEASEIVGKAGNALSTLGGVAADIATGGLALAAGAIVGLGKGVADAGVAIFKLAMDAAPLQGVASTFAGMAEEAGSSGDVMLQALQDASAGMVTGADLMTTYNKAAQMVSGTFAAQLPDAMGYLSKVAAATGQDMGFMLDSLVTGVGRLSPMILDNLNIQVDMTAANEAYAAQLGISTKEMTKQEQQAALMAEVLKQLETNTAALPEVTGTASQQIAALKTSFQDAKDSIGLAFVPALSELLGPLTELADTVGPQVVEWAQIAGQWLGEKVPIAVEWLKAKWDELWPDLWNASQQLLRDMEPLWTWLRQEFGDFTNTILPWLQEAWANLQRGWEEITRIWTRDLQPALADLADALGIGSGESSEFGEIIGNLAGSLIWAQIKGAIEMVKFALELFTVAAEGVTGAIDAVSNTIDWFKQRWDSIRDIKLPDWLTPGSPTPFELGLRGIADAIEGMPDLGGRLGLPVGMGVGGMTALAPAMAGAGPTYYITNQFGPGSVRSDDDIEEIARRQEQILVHRGVRTFEV